MPDRTVATNRVGQWSFVSRKNRPNPFAEVELDAIVAGPGGRSWRVPAFWAGGKGWRFRFAAPKAGTYSYRTECSDRTDTGLHGRGGTFRAVAYKGDNPLYHHGRIGLADNRRYFRHVDGKPFFWLGDTWWMGLTNRLKWKKEIAALAADRVKKGFTVIQIVAGLYPDMPWLDPRGANEAGFPYDKDFTRVNPKWYDYADRKIALIVDSGMAPCLVGCWGYFLMWMGTDAMKRHWRYLVARYGAYPVFWCLAGEAIMPYYDLWIGPKTDPAEADRHRAAQKVGWTEMARYVRGIDPFGNLISIHPGDSGRDCVLDDSLLDFNMLQTGHGGYGALPHTLKVVQRECARQPIMPVVQSEVTYEGILGQNKDDVQRAMFWMCWLNGVAGYTYGANGIWQLNRPERPYGPSPHGASWGNRSWQDASRLPGSAVVALGKRLLQKYAWWEFQPHPEWSGDPESAQSWDRPQAAGIPGKVMVLYFQDSKAPWAAADSGRLSGLVPRGAYRARWIDPESGLEYPLGRITADAQGRWLTPYSPIIGSILLILERIAGRAAE
jgi:hypothetical protein